MRRCILNLDRGLPGRCAAGALLGVLFLWAYWPTLVETARRWSHDPQYSHGYVVPFFALFLLWQYRQRLARSRWTACGGGVLLLAISAAIRLVGGYFFLPWLDAVSLLFCLAALFVLLGGWPALRGAWPAVAYLVFMLPLPYGLQNALAHPLQRTATLASTYLLEVLGQPALAEGNIILLDDVQIGVVEACNGLSMLVTFFALATAVALVIRRHWIYKLAAVLSAIPIALAANTLRIVATAMLHRTVDSRTANLFFHDLAGWLMMPLGLALLGLELWLLNRLVRTPGPRPGPLVLSPEPAGRSARSAGGGVDAVAVAVPGSGTAAW
jgi:exosortase